MNKFAKKLLLAAAAGALSASALTGCAKVNPDKAIATVNDTKITAGEAAFYLRYLQAGTEAMFGSMFGGTDFWNQDLMGTGQAYGETLKSQAIGQLEEAVLMEQHQADYGVSLTEQDEAAIDEAVQAFLDANDKDVQKAMYANEKTVKRVLTLLTIDQKMSAAIRAEADTNVTDEEAAQKTIEYVYFGAGPTTDEEGNSVERTDEEKEAIRQQAVDVIAAAKGGKTLEEAVGEIDADKTVSTNSYGANDSVLSEELRTAADALSDGQVCDEPVEIENGWYVVRMVTTFDRAATDQEKESIREERKSAHLTETVDGWAPEDIGLDRGIWDKIAFDVTFYQQTEAETETESASEEATEAETEGASEEATEAETESASEEATEEITEGASEEVTEEIAEGASEEVTEEITEGAPEEVTEVATEGVTE